MYVCYYYVHLCMADQASDGGDGGGDRPVHGRQVAATIESFRMQD